ncbi:MAG: hypothetical protein ACYC2G_03340 [Gemmatimonadaceae bacterium]
MIPYTTYKLIHLFGLLLAFSALGGMAVHAAGGAARRASGVRGVVLTMHGLGVFLLLLGGFGMLARLGIVQGGLPGWILVKLGLWTVVAVLAALPYRKPALAGWTLVTLPFLGAFAAYMALYKPV